VAGPIVAGVQPRTEICDNLAACIAEAEREGWRGEVESLTATLSAARDKLARLVGLPPTPVLLGLPSTNSTTG